MFGLFKKKPSVGPDFSGIDSLGKAEELLAKGQLEKLFLLPKEFGGEDIPQNVVFVPVGIGAAKLRIDLGTIAPLISKGEISEYAAVPNYCGNSMIPTSIQIQAWDPKKISVSIEIWGEGKA